MRNLNYNMIHVMAISALILIAIIAVAKAAELEISDAWIRALPASDPSGGYFTLHNSSGKAMTLISASSPACGKLMLHQTENMGGMMMMKDTSSVDVPAGGTIKFSPGGYHLMCMGTTSAIKPGATVPVKLNFKDGSSLLTSFSVRDATGK